MLFLRLFFFLLLGEHELKVNATRPEERPSLHDKTTRPRRCIASITAATTSCWAWQLVAMKASTRAHGRGAEEYALREGGAREIRVRLHIYERLSRTSTKTSCVAGRSSIHWGGLVAVALTVSGWAEAWAATRSVSFAAVSARVRRRLVGSVRDVEWLPMAMLMEPVQPAPREKSASQASWSDGIEGYCRVWGVKEA